MIHLISFLMGAVVASAIIYGFSTILATTVGPPSCRNLIVGAWLWPFVTLITIFNAWLIWKLRP